MHQRTDISIGTRRRALSLCVAAVAVLLVAAQFAARSEVLLRRPLESGLAALGHELNGRFAVGAIEAEGVWGVRLRDVRFHPHLVAPPSGDQPLVVVELVHVRPTLSALLRGRPGIASVAFEGVEATVVAGADGSHADWLRWLAHRARQGDGFAPTQFGAAPSVRAASAPPSITLADAHVSVRDEAGRFPDVDARLDHVTIRPIAGGNPGTVDGDVLIEGLGRGAVTGSFGAAGTRLSVRLLDPNDLIPLLPTAIPVIPGAQLAAGGVHVEWPPRFVLSDVHATGLGAALPVFEHHVVDDVVAASVAIAADEGGLSVDAVDLAVGVSAPAPIDVPIARVSWHRSWAGDDTETTIRLSGPDGGVADIAISAHGDAAVGVRASARDFDVRLLGALAPADAPIRPLGGAFTGAWSGTWDADDGVASVSVNGSLVELAVDAPLVSAEPLRGLRVDIDAMAHSRPRDAAFAVDNARLMFPDLGLYVHGRASRDPTRTTLRLDASMRPMPAQTLLDALPPGAIDALAGMRVAGELGGRIHLDVDTAQLDGIAFTTSFDTATFAVLEFGPRSPIASLTDPAFAWPVRTFDGSVRRIGPGDPSWSPLDSVPAVTWRAVIAAEDDRFWSHAGFDGVAMQEAIRANVEAGRIVRGGSTISQQVVKNLFLDDDRTLARKLQEAFLTWQLERHLTKSQILEYYLNVAHWGPHVYGLREAAVAYFDHVPAQLTLRESAFLAAILPNPTLFGEQYTQGVVSPSRLTKMANILANLQRAGYLSEATMRYHLDLIERGEISATPAPRHLGMHDHTGPPPRLGALGLLLFD